MDELRERTEPQEIVDWYIPRQGTEVVDCYVHHQPLPECVRPSPAPAPKKKKRLGLWIFLGIMAVVAAVLVVCALLCPADEPTHTPDGAEDGDASSIVDIFADHHTTIPRVDSYDPSRQLTLAADHGPELTAQEVYARVNPATVLVVAEMDAESAAIGTGIIMTGDGYVITNAHVISGGTSCWVLLSSGSDYDARLVGYDADEDIAVLKLENAQDLPTAEFGDSELALVGDPVYAIGNPLGLDLIGTFTDGMVSAIDRQLPEDVSLPLIQTNASLNSGNSGGPLINRYGQVVGINTMKFVRHYRADTGVEGLGFSIPISECAYLVNNLVRTGEIGEETALGIMVLTTPVTLPDGTHALKIDSVTENGAGDKAGIPGGSYLVSADGEAIEESIDLLRIRRSHDPGETISLVIWHEGLYRTYEVLPE